MTTNFLDASKRHRDDAAHLLTDKRWANADHLIGLSAECALKAVMSGLDMELRKNGVPFDQKHRTHINQLFNEFISFTQDRKGAKYAAMISSNNNPFDDWDISQRYEHRSFCTKQTVEKHCQAAKTILAILQAADLDGIV